MKFLRLSLSFVYILYYDISNNDWKNGRDLIAYRIPVYASLYQRSLANEAFVILGLSVTIFLLVIHRIAKPRLNTIQTGYRQRMQDFSPPAMPEPNCPSPAPIRSMVMYVMKSFNDHANGHLKHAFCSNDSVSIDIGDALSLYPLSLSRSWGESENRFRDMLMLSKGKRWGQNEASFNDELRIDSLSLISIA